MAGHTSADLPLPLNFVIIFSSRDLRNNISTIICKSGLFFWLHFRWFWHFYAVSVSWNTLLLVFHLNLKFQGQSYPSWLIRLLDLLTSTPSPSKEGRLPPPSPWSNWFISYLILTLCSVPQLSTLLLLPLICIHSLRRLQECLCVSVFSDTGAIHLVQYVFGLSYYVLLGLTALCSDRQGQGLPAVAFCTVYDSGSVLVALTLPLLFLQEMDLSSHSWTGST